MQLKHGWKFIMGALAIGAIALGVTACSSTPSASATQAPPKNLILASDMVSSNGCVLQSVYSPGDTVVFRVRVYDPVTGKQMDDKDLSSVVITLPDGQSFPEKYSGHPSTNPLDSFWATGWTIPADYPSGTLSYKATATANDGRTGTYDVFNVTSSELTIK